MRGYTRHKGGRTGEFSARAVGFEKEAAAAKYLKERGYEILVRNFCGRNGEIDIIAKEGGTLVFAEVKYRKSSDYGMPQEAVDRRKIGRIVRTARYYLLKEGLPEDTPCRFDVVMILGGEISVIQNAFDA